MTELEHLETQILQRLALLAEGGVTNLDPNRVHQSSSESNPPPGTDEDNAGVLRPEVSLMAYHQGLMLKACEKGTHARHMAIAAAELDYETAIKRPPAYIEPDSDQNAADRDEAILRWAGKRAEWVAVIENCSFSHVRKLRRLHKMNQATGEPLEEPVT